MKVKTSPFFSNIKVLHGSTVEYQPQVFSLNLKVFSPPDSIFDTCASTSSNHIFFFSETQHMSRCRFESANIVSALLLAFHGGKWLITTRRKKFEPGRQEKMTSTAGETTIPIDKTQLATFAQHILENYFFGWLTYVSLRFCHYPKPKSSTTFPSTIKNNPLKK